MMNDDDDAVGARQIELSRISLPTRPRYSARKHQHYQIIAHQMQEPWVQL